MYKKSTVIYWITNISPKMLNNIQAIILYSILEARETIVKNLQLHAWIIIAYY